MRMCCEDSQTNFSQKGRRQQDTVTQPQIGCRQWLRLCRDPHSAIQGTVSVRSTNYCLTVHTGNIRGLRRVGMSRLWPRQSTEPSTLIPISESLLRMINEDKRMIIVDYSAASWPLVIVVTHTHTAPCYSVAWSTKTHLGWSEGMIWQGAKTHSSLCYINIHIPLLYSFI